MIGYNKVGEDDVAYIYINHKFADPQRSNAQIA